MWKENWSQRKQKWVGVGKFEGICMLLNLLQLGSEQRIKVVTKPLFKRPGQMEAESELGSEGGKIGAEPKRECK